MKTKKLFINTVFFISITCSLSFKPVNLYTRLNRNPSKINNVKTLHKLGMKHYYGRKYRYALKYFKKILEINPVHQDALYNCACMYALMREADKAVRYLKKLFRLNPNWKRKLKTERDFRYIRNNVIFKKLISEMFNNTNTNYTMPLSSPLYKNVYIIGWAKSKTYVCYGKYVETGANIGGRLDLTQINITNVLTGVKLWNYYLSRHSASPEATVNSRTYSSFKDFWNSESRVIKKNLKKYGIIDTRQTLHHINGLYRYNARVWTKDVPVGDGFTLTEVHFKYKNNVRTIFKTGTPYTGVKIIGFAKSPFYNAFIILLELYERAGPSSGSKSTHFIYTYFNI